MTKEEAIAELSVLHERLSNPKDCEDGCYSWEDGWYVEAIDMAIEALSTDAVSLTGTMKYLTKPHNYCEVVRCKDCRQKHIGGSVTHYYWCDLWDREVDGDNYCSWAERRDP